MFFTSVVDAMCNELHPCVELMEHKDRLELAVDAIANYPQEESK